MEIDETATDKKGYSARFDRDKVYIFNKVDECINIYNEDDIENIALEHHKKYEHF